MEQLKQDIKKSRKIAESSLNAYVRNIKVMAKAITGEDYKNLDFLKDFDKVKEFLETNKASTKKNRLASISVVLRIDEDKNEELIKKYNEYMYDVAKKYEEEIAKNKKSKVQSDNWVKLDELLKVFNILKKEVFAEELHKGHKKFASKDEKELLQKFMVSSLYTLIPPRRNRDFSEMKVITEAEYNKLTDSEKDDLNYLVIKNKSNMFFSFGDYKTKRVHGLQKVVIPKKLRQVLNIWRKFNPKAEWLISNNRGNKMSANSLTKYLMKIFSKTGKKNISSSMLRHIFITYNPTLKEIREQKKEGEKIAKDMGHTTDMQEKYVKKD